MLEYCYVLVINSNANSIRVNQCLSGPPGYPKFAPAIKWRIKIKKKKKCLQGINNGNNMKYNHFWTRDKRKTNAIFKIN